MFFSYKTRRILAGIFPALLTILVLILVAVVCWLLWLQRFVVYTPQGAIFDFDLQPPAVPGVIPQRPSNGYVSIEYPDEHPEASRPPDVPDDPDDPDDPDKPVTPERMGITGYYADIKAIQADPEEVRRQIEQLPDGTAVLIQVANFWGYRYFTSEYGKPSNAEALDGLLEWLAGRDLHLIARMPAFRDFYFSVDFPLCGLKNPQGYLWPDANRCYWLDPTNEKVLTRLTQIIRELKSLGFDEVVFDDFTMPETEEIIFEGDRREAVYAAAETLVIASATDAFTVSFITTDYDFRLPEGNCRLYVEGVEPAQVEDVLQQIQTPNDAIHIVFFCSTFDNRFDGCSVLRPIELA